MVRADDLTKYAIGFILSYPEVTAVIPGIRNLEQLKSHLKNGDYILPQGIKEKMQDLYKQKIQKDPLPW